MMEKNLEKIEKEISFLKVNLGDEVMEKNTNRLGWVHKTKVFGSKNCFIVTWLDDGTKKAYLSKKEQQNLIKTGNNIYQEDSD